MSAPTLTTVTATLPAPTRFDDVDTREPGRQAYHLLGCFPTYHRVHPRLHVVVGIEWGGRHWVAIGPRSVPIADERPNGRLDRVLLAPVAFLRRDHRLRRLIQTTGDLGLAVRYGVPGSTARGWLKQSRTDVVSIDVLDMDAEALQQELLSLRRRVTRLLALLHLVVVAIRVAEFSFDRVLL